MTERDEQDRPSADETNETDARPAQADATGGDDAGDAGFASLGLDERLLQALTALGYEEPTPIQREAIPPMLAGRDLLGQAATGTGKTAAFALPLLHRTAPFEQAEGGPCALILVPTRELAMQVAEAVHKYGKALGVSVLPVYGGTAIQQQLRALRRGVDVVVATPGRAMDHIRRGTLDLGAVRVAVLDEADEMLDMGFAEDLEAILETLPESRQTALFSATMPPRIAAIAERHLREPVRVMIARERTAPGEVPRVKQTAYVVRREHKTAALGRVLDIEAPTSAIVFCRTRTEVDSLTETLAGRGYRPEALHGGLSQEQRDRVLRRFRDGTAELLVATDVAARGLDIEHVSHVVNFDVPSSPDVYVHRIGRTGRAGREGTAITFAEPREHRQLRNIEHLTKQKIAIESVPTVVDLRARRLEMVRASIQESLISDELDSYRVVVETLASEFDVMDVAAAAVKLAMDAEGGEAEEAEIPDAAPPNEWDRGRKAGRFGKEKRFERERPGRFERDRPPRAPRAEPEERERGSRGERTERAERFARELDAGERGPREDRGSGKGSSARRGPARGRGRVGETDVTRLYVGLGRQAGVRPADLVGAIANEAGVDSRAIGAIDIADRFSLVEVPAQAANDIISALRGTTIRGKRPVVRLDREE
jgi:ATP-dependent RNA helicase DeaD